MTISTKHTDIKHICNIYARISKRGVPIIIMSHLLCSAAFQGLAKFLPWMQNDSLMLKNNERKDGSLCVSMHSDFLFSRIVAERAPSSLSVS